MPNPEASLERVAAHLADYREWFPIIGSHISGVLVITKSARDRGGHGCREEQ